MVTGTQPHATPTDNIHMNESTGFDGTTRVWDATSCCPAALLRDGAAD